MEGQLNRGHGVEIRAIRDIASISYQLPQSSSISKIKEPWDLSIYSLFKTTIKVFHVPASPFSMMPFLCLVETF
jgi:hypothetical protein